MYQRHAVPIDALFLKSKAMLNADKTIRFIKSLPPLKDPRHRREMSRVEANRMIAKNA
jgi:hypothetical protein